MAFAGKGESVRVAAEKAARWTAGELARHSWSRKGPTNSKNAPARIARMNAWHEGARVIRAKVGKPPSAYARKLSKAVLARFEMLIMLPTDGVSGTAVLGGATSNDADDGLAGDAQPALWHVVVETRGDYTPTHPYVLVRKAPAVALGADLRTLDVDKLSPPWVSLLEDCPHDKLSTRSALVPGADLPGGPRDEQRSTVTAARGLLEPDTAAGDPAIAGDFKNAAPMPEGGGAPNHWLGFFSCFGAQSSVARA